MNLDRMYECMGQENSPYVVCRLISNHSIRPQNGKQKQLRPEHEEEIGYVVSYISHGFEKLILN